MPQPPTGLGLPLVDHLVKQRSGGSGPSVVSQVSMREGDLWSLPRGLHRPELPQPAAHPAGKPDVGRPEASAETTGIELGMERLKPVERGRILGARRIGGPANRRPRGSVGMHREGDQDPLRQTPLGATEAGPSPSRDSGHHVVGSGLVAAMDPERAAARHADQDSPIGVEDHRNRLGQAVGAEPNGEQLGHAGFIRP